jgi:magnesium transporter
VLAGEFGFHPLAVEDATKQHQRPKIDRYDDFYFMVFYDIDYLDEDNRIDEHELDIFLGKNFLITVHDEAIAEVAEVAERFARNLTLIEHGIGVLLYTLLDTIVDHYFPVAERIREHIEQLERRVLTARHPRDRADLQADIFALRRELLQMRRVTDPERDVLAVLARRDLPVISKKAAVYFQDVHDHLLRVTDAVNMYRDLLSSVLDSYHAQTANNLNQVMRVLTSCSIILMSVTFIASIYGMNFNPEASPYNMPELNSYYGYPVTLFVMVVVGLTLVWLLRRKGWL